MVEKVVLVSDAGHRTSDIPGGVQVCTAEYIELLEAAGLDVVFFDVVHTRKVWPRLKIKLGLEVYERYDFESVFDDLHAAIIASGARIVALNQLALVGFAPLLKRAFGDTIKVVVLSHGNESGDFLHEIIRPSGRRGPSGWLRDIWRMGRLLIAEAQAFTSFVDCVLVLSETERQIDNWLGAKVTHFVPRTFRPEDIGWKPVLGRVGFVGSLNHKPNLDGLRAVLEALTARRGTSLHVRIVGGPHAAGRALERDYEFVEYLGTLTSGELKDEAASWALFLNPVFWYSRGASTKLSQAISWGIPVLSTPAGNRGYVWDEGEIATVDTAAQMAELITVSADDIGRLDLLAKGVRTAACNGPSISDLGADLRKLLGTRPGVGS